MLHWMLYLIFPYIKLSLKIKKNVSFKKFGYSTVNAMSMSVCDEIFSTQVVFY